MSKNTRIAIRVDEDLRDRLEKITELRAESLSDFLRRAMLRELARFDMVSEEEKKALGI